MESKIKNDVERDKKLYNILKQNTKAVNLNKENEYTFPRKKDKNNTDSNLKRIMTSDYKIEYDKSLKPQAIREKSIERKVLSNQEFPRSYPEERSNNNRKVQITQQNSYQEDRVDFNRKEPMTKLSNNNIDYTPENDNLMYVISLS